MNGLYLCSYSCKHIHIITNDRIEWIIIIADFLLIMIALGTLANPLFINAEMHACDVF